MGLRFGILRCRGRLRAVFGLLVALLAAAVWAGPALADTTVTVNTNSDSPSAGQCSLREAVLYADGTSEPGCSSQPVAGTTTITLPANVYVLSPASGTLAITRHTVIDGAGAGATTISGDDAVQVLNVASGVQASLDGVTITDGMSPGNGGAIGTGGTLTLSNVMVTDSHAADGVSPVTKQCHLACPSGTAGSAGGAGGDGGAIYNTGQLHIDHSEITGNIAGSGGDGSNGVSATSGGGSAGQAGGNAGAAGNGGGIDNAAGAQLTLTDAAVIDNTAGRGGNPGSGSNATDSAGAGGAGGQSVAGGSGGGIANSGTLTISRSTVASNETSVGGGAGSGGAGSGGGASGATSFAGFGGDGGGLYADGGSLQLTNVTIAGNDARATQSSDHGGYGGGVWANGGTFALSFVTIADNVSDGQPAGINLVGSASATEADSIIAVNTRDGLASNCEYPPTDGAHNVTFPFAGCAGTLADPKLGDLADNGGAAQTLALGPGSGAAGLVPAADCPATDERGLARPAGQPCDAGAYQRVAPAIAGASATAGSATTATVTASIDPNLGGSDTAAMVQYGTTPSLGTTTAAQDLGRGGSTLPFSATLTGLAVGTTYYYAIAATNGDGTTTSSPQTFTTPPVTSGGGGSPGAGTGTGTGTGTGPGAGSPSSRVQHAVSIGTVKVSGDAAKIAVACPAASPVPCAPALSFKVTETVTGGKVTAVTAAKRRTVKRMLTLGSSKLTLAAGRHRTVTVSLSGAGRRLLAARHRLTVRLYVLQATTSRATRKITFSRPRRR
jgi:hypothetical protein